MCVLFQGLGRVDEILTLLGQEGCINASFENKAKPEAPNVGYLLSFFFEGIPSNKRK